MLTVELITHIRRDERGVAWIDDTKIKVLEVVQDWLAHGSSPEEMHREYPHLSLSQIHAAMACYYDHQADFDAQAEQSLQRAKALHAQATGQPSRAQLQARLNRR